MERMSIDPSSSPTKSATPRPTPAPRPLETHDPYSNKSPPSSNYYLKPSPNNNIATPLQSPAGLNRSYPQQTAPPNGTYLDHRADPPKPNGSSSMNDPYNPMAYPFQTPLSPPTAGHGMYFPNHAQATPQAYPQHGQYLPQGYIPPPPPGPPPQMTHDTRIWLIRRDLEVTRITSHHVKAAADPRKESSMTLGLDSMHGNE